MKIVLSGYYGFDNAGDEALLAAITSTIRKLQPRAEFLVFSGHPARTVKLHGIPAVYYMNPLHLIRELSRADLLISGGGSIFQDVTSARSLIYYIFVVALARMLGVPVIFYAQGVGPIQRGFSKFLMRCVSNRVNLITLRDEESARFLRRLGVERPPLVITADPVFSLQADEKDKMVMQDLLDRAGLTESPLVGVSLRRWPGRAQDLSGLAALLDRMAERGYQVVFIPLAFPEDIEPSRQLAAMMRHRATVIDRHLSSREHLALIKHLSLMIGMRLHSLIFAASQGVPFAGISYDPKIDAFLDLFGLRPLSLEAEAMAAEINRLLEDTDLQTAIEQKAAAMRQRSEETARLALGLIHGGYRESGERINAD